MTMQQYTASEGHNFVSKCDIKLLHCLGCTAHSAQLKMAYTKQHVQTDTTRQLVEVTADTALAANPADQAYVLKRSAFELSGLNDMA